MQFPEFQVIAPSDQHHCLNPHSTVFYARLGKARAKLSGFPTGEPPHQLPLPRRLRSPHLPTSLPSPPKVRPGLTSLPPAWGPRPVLLSPQAQAEEQEPSTTGSHFTLLFRNTEAAKPSSVPAGRWPALNALARKASSLTHGKALSIRLPNECESHLGPTTSCSEAALAAEG